MPQHEHEADLDRVRRQAHEQGREQGRAEVLPFAGVAGVRFPSDLPTHQAVVSYEQLLMEAQPHHLHERVGAVQEAIDRLFEEHHQADVDLKSVHLRDTGRSPRAWLRRLLATRALEQRVDDTLVELHAWTTHRDQAGVDVTAAAEELTAVRAWLDQLTQDAARYTAERTWRRRPLSGPPSWVRTYPTSKAFVDEDPRRGRPGSGRLRDDVGTDHRSGWTWTDPSTPSAPATLWQVSWLPDPGELYAVRDADPDAAAERPDEAVDTRPVWLLKSLPVHGNEDASQAVADHMETLEHLRDDVARESLLALVDAVGATDWQRVLARAGRG